MFVGKVIGTVWSTVKWPAIVGHKLLIVRPYHLAELRQKTDGAAAAAPTGEPETVICIDLLDAGVGDDVVVAFGHAARVAAEADGTSLHPHGGPAASNTPPITPIDAAVVAVVDGYALPNPVALDGTTR